MLSTISPNDLQYEEDILRNPYSVKSWVRYIDHKRSSGIKGLSSIYERSVKQLPYSYKLWYNYLKLLRIHSKKYNPSNSIYEETNNGHERALVTMHKMPRIWIDYLTFLKEQGFITRFRRAFDRALRSLPSTQHKRIWIVAIEFILLHCNRVPETVLRMYRRYIEFAPEDSEDFVEFLISHKRINEAATKLVNILNDEKFVSKNGKSKFQLWMMLCDLITGNSDKISLNFDAIIRQGISLYKDQVGILWNALAKSYIYCNNFERARDIYEEAMRSIETVADFKLVFQAFLDFSQQLIKQKISLQQPDIEMEIEKCEDLINRRALLLNSVILKQNPHNVKNWLERVRLYKDFGPQHQFNTFREAIDTVDISKATSGRVSELWIEMAQLYESYGKIDDSRIVLDESVKRIFLKVEDLADCYCARVEMEIRQRNISEAFRILENALKRPLRHVNFHDKSVPASEKVHKCFKLWALFADLSMSFRSVDEAKQVYDEIIDLRIATPSTILHYADFLEQNNYFEQAFKVYQKGVSTFKWPQVYDIWLNYLKKYVERYENRHYERGIELFSSCLEHCPAEHSKEFYLMYANYVEKYGLSKKALEIYQKTAQSAKPEQRYELFLLYIEKVRHYCGLVATRPIYEMAIDQLLDIDTKKLCIRFAEMEIQLGEVDRARSIYSFCSQFCDPRITEEEFWSKWLDFETKYGNSDTISNLNLVKRSVEAKYNTHQSLLNIHLQQAVVTEDSMQQLEANLQKVPNPIAFVSGGTTHDTIEEPNNNPEAIELDMNEEDEDEDDDADMPQEIPVPDEVFGNLIK